MAKGKKIAATNGPVEPIHVFAGELAEIIAIIKPFFIWPLVIIGAFLLHHFWADCNYVLAFVAAVTVAIPVLIATVTKNLDVPQFIHTVLTCIIVGGILGAVDVLGWHSATVFAMLMVVPALCLTWSVRGAIADRELERGQHLSNFFEQAGLPDTHIKVHKKPKKPKRNWRNWRGGFAPDPEPETIAMPDGKQRRPKVDTRVTGTVHLPPGGIPDDVVDNARRVESAAGWPPGTIQVTPNIDHAGVGDVIISDPRTIKEPTYYPGSSYIGASMEDTISVGVYQDGTECEFAIPETQIQIMGQVGSGKSLGGGWSIMGECITRYDAVIWAIDITKGYQTLGPLSTALHRIGTTPDEAISILEDTHALIKPRTNYLAEHGLSKWRKGCGLNYLVVWIEEVPDVIRALGEPGKQAWIRTVKAARSAGITVVWSLQRADFKEAPTITRGQAVKMCFGVSDTKESQFGLSSVQKTGGCQPELWGQRQPGMCYLDAPGIPESYVPMALRTFYWGEDDSLIRAHASKFPASARVYDPVMKAVLEGTAQPSTPTRGRARHFAEPEEDEMPEVEETPEEPDKPTKLDPDTARKHMRMWLRDHAGQTVHNADFAEVRKEVGYGYAWGYKVMHEFERAGLVEKVKLDDGPGWKVADNVTV